MNTKIEEAFENALTNLQHVLIARRVLASDEQVRLNWNHFNIMALVKEHGSILPSQISDELILSRPMLSISEMGHFLNRTLWRNQAALASSLRLRL